MRSLFNLLVLDMALDMTDKVVNGPNAKRGGYSVLGLG